jgi:hypothetical protein
MHLFDNVKEKKYESGGCVVERASLCVQPKQRETQNKRQNMERQKSSHCLKP